jgi:serine/threonine-protein kinase RsbW
VNQPVAATASADVVELRIPAKAEWVAVARLAVAAVASRLDFSVEDIEDVRLAIAEACTNVIRHAPLGEQIAIRCEASATELSVDVHGGPAVRLRADFRSEDGLGIVIIQSLMDAVEYRAETSGIVLQMIKRVQTAR